VFPDLDALILAVNGRTLDAIDAAMRETEPGIGAAEHLARLADSYLSFAVANRQRWRALFQHQLPPGRAITSAYAQRQAIAFSWVEAPLVNLQPGLAPPSRALLARSLFAAVHGMVELGLDEKVAEMPLPVLRDQIRLIVRAVASGLARG
jgi:AcrR family transcriptional regulator